MNNVILQFPADMLERISTTSLEEARDRYDSLAKTEGNIMSILRDKRLYENQIVVDTSQEIDLYDLKGLSLTEFSEYFRNLDQELSSLYPSKQFRVRPGYEDESVLEIEVYHVESDEERDARIRSQEDDVIQLHMRAKVNSKEFRREMYEALKAEFENIKPKSALRHVE